MHIHSLEKLVTNIDSSIVAGWLARIESPQDYLAHSILHWITSNAKFDTWSDEAREKRRMNLSED